MFDSIGWGEILVILIGALFIFGPDRLPTMAKDAAGALRRIRETVTGARTQLHDQLGPDFDHLRNVDLRTLNPKTFVKKHLMEDVDSPPVHRSSGSRAASANRSRVGASASGASGSAGTTSAGPASVPAATEPAASAPATPAMTSTPERVSSPYDAEAT